MAVSRNLTLRQTIEGMTLIFNPAAAGDLQAVLQFEVCGTEPGAYSLYIANGECTFQPGTAANPSLTISTPAEVWLKISSGELDGMSALMQGAYSANGDLSLLMRMNELFKGGDSFTTASPNPNPPGPIALSGMMWMQLALAPWIIFWIFFHPGGSPWLSIALPLALSMAISAYRLRYNETTLLETGSAAFFALAGLLVWAGAERFAVTGSLRGSLYLAALWFVSLFLPMPLCGEYSKWAFIRPLWRNSMFIYPNAVIALVWGWQFIFSVLVGMAAERFPNWAGLLTAVRYLLIIPAAYFTIDFQRRAEGIRLANFEKTYQQLRAWAVAGLLVAVLLAGWIWAAL